MRTARFDRSAYVADFKGRHHVYEVRAYKTFKPALDLQIKPVIAHVKAYGSVTPSIIDMLITKQPLQDAYRSMYATVGVLHADWQRKRINSLGKAQKSIPGFFSERWKKLMEAFFYNESATRISDVTDTTRERVRKVLADSEGMPISDRASYITDTLGADDFNRTRALMIARTESTTAANYGASLGNEDADYETAKQWMAVMDSNTRPDHVDADGQTVANTDLFVVGGSMCMYPGDISLPAAESINCRCSVAYVPLLSETGLPILK